ncbi:uncharacterized protein LOC127863458 [Dreissena polymorpha]|uniref:uncharacterized protein LOC127863458 n=1 Tax=Dreissena polymorpha TaxID=45954 RepID=UPI002264B74D|nr:uncharacterized protein LOC127863458 [Dreissena polymorpha]
MKTIQHAITILKGFKYDTAYIELLKGHHDLEATLQINISNVVIRSYQRQTVYVTGGKPIESRYFKHVTDHDVLATLPHIARQHVRVVHLPDVGITNFGTINEFGFYRQNPAPIEMFFNGKPLHVAQWPNEGFINIIEVPAGPNGTRFQYNSSVPTGWVNETDLWVYGYWFWSWADMSVKVATLNASTGIVTLVKNPQFGLKIGHFGGPPEQVRFADQGGYFRFYNVFSELDSSGEYYMDRSSGNLYVWMPNQDGNISLSDVTYVSLINDCINIAQNVHDITLTDFTLEACRGHGISGVNVHDIQIQNLEIRNTGLTGALFSGDSRDVTISQCMIHDVGGGITVYGGKRALLESSGAVIENNEIYDFSRLGAVGYNAITINGVGHLVRHNTIYNGQYTGIMYHGNDIVMEYNHVHHTCVNASDCGALHTGRDWTTRGNKIRYNLVTDTLRLVPGADVRGVMLDDQSSSTTIVNNVFSNNEVHVNIGGGRDNIVANNVFYGATRYSMQVDGRGVGHPNDKDLMERLHQMPYTSALWSMRYPELAIIDQRNKSLPEGNQIHKNVVYNSGTVGYIPTKRGWLDNIKLFNETDTILAFGSTDFYDVGNADFRLRCFAKNLANEVGFVQVPPPGEYGCKGSVGPVHLNRVPATLRSNPSTGPCTTKAPLTTSPAPAYLPDGARTNNLYNVSDSGCWLVVSKCTAHPNDVGTHRDTYAHANDNETACFQRAVQQWYDCGNHENEQVVAIYGPSGAMTLAGDGCFMSTYGCPNHGGPVDGHALTTGSIYRDSYAESQGAAHNEETCLRRAQAQWVYCGSFANHPVTSIYRPSGAVRTSGAGCWIHAQQCNMIPKPRSMFYDAWGAANLNTDDIEEACLRQAVYYWRKCGSDPAYPVTAYFRPSTASHTYPAIA